MRKRLEGILLPVLIGLSLSLVGLSFEARLKKVMTPEKQLDLVIVNRTSIDAMIQSAPLYGFSNCCAIVIMEQKGRKWACVCSNDYYGPPIELRHWGFKQPEVEK